MIKRKYSESFCFFLSTLILILSAQAREGENLATQHLSSFHAQENLTNNMSLAVPILPNHPIINRDNIANYTPQDLYFGGQKVYEWPITTTIPDWVSIQVAHFSSCYQSGWILDQWGRVYQFTHSDQIKNPMGAAYPITSFDYQRVSHDISSNPLPEMGQLHQGGCSPILSGESYFQFLLGKNGVLYLLGQVDRIFYDTLFPGTIWKELRPLKVVNEEGESIHFIRASSSSNMLFAIDQGGNLWGEGLSVIQDKLLYPLGNENQFKRDWKDYPTLHPIHVEFITSKGKISSVYFKDVCAASDHALFLDSKGSVWVSGDNHRYVLGSLKWEDSQDLSYRGFQQIIPGIYPLDMQAIGAVEAISCGENGSMILNQKGEVWISNYESSQKSHSSQFVSLDIQNHGKIAKIKKIAYGDQFSLALSSGGDVYVLNQTGTFSYKKVSLPDLNPEAIYHAGSQFYLIDTKGRLWKGEAEKSLSSLEMGEDNWSIRQIPLGLR